jgi:UDP:flavonoid glycosyltransferase YjiC (YdhE family)
MSAKQPSIVFFCMPEAGHFQAIRPLIASVAARGMVPHVFTHRNFEAETIRLGGRFVNLFDRYSIDAADDSSRPIPCRYVSFAGHFGHQVIEDVRTLGPSLIIYETFSVIGPVVAKALDIPYVNVCVNHNPNPARCLNELTQNPLIAISEQCQRAVVRLRNEFGQAPASPFAYVSLLSPLLNIYCEPPQFLSHADRSALEPLAFFGSILGPPSTTAASHSHDRCFDPFEPDDLRVYVSFGTVIWRYFAEEAWAALRAISQACAAMHHVRACISPAEANAQQHLMNSLVNDNVRVYRWVDQYSALAQADIFVTHHGLNSTHEAILHGVPMLSYPFFSDQPALARKCQDLGLALPLGSAPRAPISVGEVTAAVLGLQDQRPILRENLARAYEWEMEVMRARDSTMERIEGLIKSTPARTTPQSSETSGLQKAHVRREDRPLRAVHAAQLPFALARPKRPAWSDRCKR